MGEQAPKLIVCGTGPMEEWCRRFVEKNKINVELRGFVSNEDVREILANSKALILPTRLYEGFPMSIVCYWSDMTRSRIILMIHGRITAVLHMIKSW